MAYGSFVIGRQSVLEPGTNSACYHSHMHKEFIRKYVNLVHQGQIRADAEATWLHVTL